MSDSNSQRKVLLADGGLKLVRMTRKMSVRVRRARSSDLPAMAVGIYGGQRSHEILTKICPGAALQ